MKLQTINTINRCIKIIRILIVATLILGLAASALSGCKENNMEATGRINEFFEYGGEKLIHSTNTSSGEDAPQVTTHTWYNHNLVSSSSGAMVLTYYRDMPGQSDDYPFFYQPVILGYEVLTSPQSRYISCNINDTTT
jgi:ABC-type oligopeptide transport system substrate-binding subunit